MLHRTHKDGLGRAYLAGFAAALEGGADLVLQMDCDFSHDPADLPRLIAATSDADVVLGSRYVPGGGVENWALRRRIQSRGGCAYARLILGVPVRDLTGGFKCWRRAALEALDLDGVDAHGYGFQIEMTYRAIKAGLSVTRGADRVSRAARGAIEDDRLDHAGGGLEGPAAALRGSRGSDRYILYSYCDSDKEREHGRRDQRGNGHQLPGRGARGDKPVLVDFWAPWCGPCRIVAPHLEELAGEREDLRIVKLNVDENPQVSAQYGVMSIPTLLLFKHGQVAHQIIGALPKSRLVQEIEPALAPGLGGFELALATRAVGGPGAPRMPPAIVVTNTRPTCGSPR